MEVARSDTVPDYVKPVKDVYIEWAETKTNELKKNTRLPINAVIGTGSSVDLSLPSLNSNSVCYNPTREGYVAGFLQGLFLMEFYR